MLANLFILSEIIMFTIYVPQNSQNSQVDLEYYFHFRKIHMNPLSSSFSLDTCLEENRGLCLLLPVNPSSCCPPRSQPTTKAPHVCVKTAFLETQLGILAEKWHFLRSGMFHRTTMFQMNLWQTQAQFQKQFPRFPAQKPRLPRFAVVRKWATKDCPKSNGTQDQEIWGISSCHWSRAESCTF